MRVEIHALVLITALVGFVMQAQAQCSFADQISPNPNPVGNTIVIVTGATGCNAFNPFDNFGTLNITAGGTLNNFSGATLNIGSSNIDLSGGTLNNDGTLNNNAGARLNIRFRSTLNNNAGATLNNNSGGILNVIGGTADNNVGATLNNSGHIGILGGSLTNFGTVNNYVGGTLVGTGTPVGNALGATLNNMGRIGSFDNAGVLNNSGTVGDSDDSNRNASTGVINNNSGGVLFGFGHLRNEGTINNNAGANIGGYGGMGLLNSGTINNYSGSTVTTGLRTIQNSGQFSVFVGASVTVDYYPFSDFVQTAGTARVDGTVTANTVNIKGGVIQGSGSITAPVTIDGGTIAPGNSPGILTINGDYTQSATGTFAAEIGGRIAGIEYDVLKVLGNATLDGTLQVSLLDLGDGLFSPHPGDTFDILSAEQIVGSFSKLLLPELRRGHAQPFFWEVDYLADAFSTTDVVRLHVAAIPEPEIYAMMLAGLGVLGFVARRKKKPQERAAA